MALRFHIAPDLAAQVNSHASIAVGLIDRLVAQHEHYAQILHTIAERQGRPPALDESDAAALTRQMFDQLKAARDDLQSLADDARQQGSDALHARTDPGHNVKIDLSLTVPAPDADAMTLLLTMHVITEALKRNCRDVGDQLQRLLVPLSKVADPGALVFAGQVEQLVTQIRPPGVARGPYAPRHL
jgi:hypothetical protein